MRIATWNVNSIRQRMDNLCAWLKERQPDVVCLQETKITDDAFPRGALEGLGYNLAVHGQKTFNGVAILSKYPLEQVTTGPARRRIRRPCAVHRGGGLAPGRRGPRRLHLSAERQPGRQREISLQAELDGSALSLRV